VSSHSGDGIGVKSFAGRLFGLVHLINEGAVFEQMASMDRMLVDQTPDHVARSSPDQAPEFVVVEFLIFDGCHY
jgi:hypothetical protein